MKRRPRQIGCRANRAKLGRSKFCHNANCCGADRRLRNFLPILGERHKVPRLCGDAKPDCYFQSAGLAIGGSDRATHRLDIAPHDPQSDSEMAFFVCRAGGPFQKIALEDTIEIAGIDPRPLVLDHEFRQTPIAPQCDADRPAGWRKADGGELKHSVERDKASRKQETK